MPGHRIQRANSFIQQEITLLLRNEVRDPRVIPLTVTSVKVTPDRRVARIYVASFEGNEVLQQALAGLESAKSFLRNRLGSILHWRFTPELEFHVDNSWEYGQKIDQLLNHLDQEREPQPDQVWGSEEPGGVVSDTDPE